MKALLLIVPLLAASCVTPGDMRVIADQMEMVEASLADESKTTEEVADDLALAKEAIRAVAADVEERTEGFIEGVGSTGESGLIGLASMAALHFYRNSTRKKTVVMKGEGQG